MWDHLGETVGSGEAMGSWGNELNSPIIKEWFTWQVQDLECLNSRAVYNFIICHGQLQQFSFAARSFLLLFPDLVCAVENLINTLVILHPKEKMVNFVRHNYRKKKESFLSFLFRVVFIPSLVSTVYQENEKATWSFLEPSPWIPLRHNTHGLC